MGRHEDWGAQPTVWVDSPSYCGPEFNTGTGTLVPVVAVERQGIGKSWDAHLKKKMFAKLTQLAQAIRSLSTNHKA